MNRRAKKIEQRIESAMFGKTMERITEVFAAWAIVIAVLMVLITITDALLLSK